MVFWQKLSNFRILKILVNYTVIVGKMEKKIYKKFSTFIVIENILVINYFEAFVVSWDNFIYW